MHRYRGPLGRGVQGGPTGSWVVAPGEVTSELRLEVWPQPTRLGGRPWGLGVDRWGGEGARVGGASRQPILPASERIREAGGRPGRRPARLSAP